MCQACFMHNLHASTPDDTPAPSSWRWRLQLIAISENIVLNLSDPGVGLHNQQLHVQIPEQGLELHAIGSPCSQQVAPSCHKFSTQCPPSRAAFIRRASTLYIIRVLYVQRFCTVYEKHTTHVNIENDLCLLYTSPSPRD